MKNDVRTLVDMEQGMSAVLEFICSEEFEKLAESVSTPKAGFLFGLSYGVLLASVKGRKFLYAPRDEGGEKK